MPKLQLQEAPGPAPAARGCVPFLAVAWAFFASVSRVFPSSFKASPFSAVQSFFDGWDVSKKKDKTKGRHDSLLSRKRPWPLMLMLAVSDRLPGLSRLVSFRRSPSGQAAVAARRPLVRLRQRQLHRRKSALTFRVPPPRSARRANANMVALSYGEAPATPELAFGSC